jgi:hypothetical protein
MVLTLTPTKNMNKQNAHQYLTLVQALAEGKTIQYRASTKWNDMIDLEFVDPPERYRIKPEPREWLLHRVPGNGPYITIADGQLYGFPEGERIRVREILD